MEARQRRPETPDEPLQTALRHRISFSITEQSPFNLAPTLPPPSQHSNLAHPTEEVIFLLDDRPRLHPPLTHPPPLQAGHPARPETAPRKGAARLTLDPGLFDPPPEQARKSKLSALKPSASLDEKVRVKFLQGQGQDLDRYRENKMHSGVIQESLKDHSVYSHSSEANTLSEFGVSPKRAFEYKASAQKRRRMLKLLPSSIAEESNRLLLADSPAPAADSRPGLPDRAENPQPLPGVAQGEQRSSRPGVFQEGRRVSSRTVYHLFFFFILLMLALELWNSQPGS